MKSILCAGVLLVTLAGAAEPRGALPVAAPVTALLIRPSDLPAGYTPDDALENADATARSQAHDAVVVASGFTGYRASREAVVQYVARLRTPTDANSFLADEAHAVALTRTGAPLTTTRPRTVRLLYQLRGTRDEVWVFAAIADGPLVSVIGAFNHSGEQAAIDRVEQLATLEDGRLIAAARRIYDAPVPSPAAPAALVLAQLDTVTHGGRVVHAYPVGSTIYWRAIWHLARHARALPETVWETVTRGPLTLYHDQLTDAPADGDNALIDHVGSRGYPPGRYEVTVGIRIGSRSVRKVCAFQLVPRAPRHP